MKHHLSAKPSQPTGPRSLPTSCTRAPKTNTLRGPLHATCLLATLATVGAAACGSSTKVRAGAELEVRWTVDGERAVTVCEDIAIDQWVVEAQRGDVVETAELSCNEDWSTRDAFVGLDAGTYTVTVIGLDGQGSEVGRSYGTEVAFDGSSSIVHEVPLFSSIAVFWNINGTIDGTALGESWDSCAEVGAETVVITIDDGAPIETSCAAAGEMSVAIEDLAVGRHEVRVKLRDGSGVDLTTEGTALFEATADGVDFVVDFFYDSFFEPQRSDTLGSYWFTTQFGGATCTEAIPTVAGQVALVKLDGTPVNDAVVCDENLSGCADADGADEFVCRSRDQVIPDLTWGLYKMVLQGTVGNEGTICWETDEEGSREIEILVGAGADNPVELIDLARSSSEGECA